MSDAALLLFTQKTAPPPIPPPVVLVPRDPLPPFDTLTYDPDTGAPLPVYTELREAPPANADVRWWRGDAWGITIPDLPPVPGGGTGPSQSRVLTYFLDRYDRAAGGGTAWEQKILDQHRANGYPHISLSPQDSFADGATEDDYVAMSVRCREAGLFVHHLMRSKYYTGASVTAAQRRDPRRNRRLLERRRMPPKKGQFEAMPDLDEPNALMERLLREGAMQIETPAWEMNFWSPDTCYAMIEHDAALIGERARIMLHFFPHYISWQRDDETPTDFWRFCYRKVDGICYQCDPEWTGGMMCARITDGLDRLAPGGLWGLGHSGRFITPEEPDGHPIDYVVWETVATQQFNNLQDGDGRVSDEDTGNCKGYQCTCSPGQLVVRGFGNGARRPDGTAL
jgi:hypothetical protein